MYVLGLRQREKSNQMTGRYAQNVYKAGAEPVEDLGWLRAQGSTPYGARMS